MNSSFSSFDVNNNNFSKSMKTPSRPSSSFGHREKQLNKQKHAKTEKKKTIRIKHDPPQPPQVEADSIAVRFFTNHPEANIDIRTLKEKIDDIDKLFLESQIDDKNLFELLVQKMTMCEIYYGEKSPEFIIALTQLGSFYNKIEKYKSAYRHLKVAYDNILEVPINNNDKFYLAVEYVLTLFELGYKNGVMDEDMLSIAENALFPFKNISDYRADIEYRRDLYIAQLKLCRRKFLKALRYYERAIKLYKIAYDPPDNATLAALHLSAGLTSLEIKDFAKAKNYFIFSKQIFEDLAIRNKVQEINEYLAFIDKVMNKECVDEEKEMYKAIPFYKMLSKIDDHPYNS